MKKSIFLLGVLLLLTPIVAFSSTRHSSALHSEEQGLVPVEAFNARGDGVTDDTVAIQNAINTATNGILLMGKHKITSALIVNDKSGFIIRGKKTSSISEVASSTLLWYGTSTSTPVIGVQQTVASGVYTNNLRIEGLSIDGNAGIATAVCGIAFGRFGETQNPLIKNVVVDNVSIRDCRFGTWVGRDATPSADIVCVAFRNLWLYNNSDAGVWIESGNAAAQSFTSCTFLENGVSPTTDAYNTGGIGCNVALMSGEASFFSCTSAGLGSATPETADIFMAGTSINIMGWWSDTHGTFLNQSGPSKALSLTGVRHYEGTMTPSNTSESIVAFGKILLNSCYLYGDVNIKNGQAGNITAIGTTLVNGKYTGELLQYPYNALVDINSNGNSANIQIGETATTTGYIGPYPPSLLIKSGRPAIQQWLQTDGGGTGATWNITPSSGYPTLIVNGYVNNHVTGDLRAITTGTISIYQFTSGSSVGLECLHHVASGTNYDIPLASFTSDFSVKRGVGVGYESENAIGFPIRSADPSFSSGDYWEGSVYYNSATNKLKVNTGGSTWVDLH